ncbi:MAG: pyrroline-5-carboxylate reductase [Lachnospiraceae bacterium]|nr:pyrroline-5-carboxylate reductase [Lachnospiraceae bacterium]
MKIGFIGCGNMATAMIGGIIAKQLVPASDLMASAKTEKTKAKIQAELGIQTGDNKTVAAASDILVLAVKPIYMEEVIKEIREDVRPETIVVTLAPGKTISWLEEMFAADVKLVRTMPNTPALVGEGMSALCPNTKVSAEDLQQVITVFESFGKAEVVSEPMIDVVVGVSGSSPAYVFMFIEAMADAAVADGMPRAQAYAFAAQSVLGSAKMVLETGKHPGELKDMVCSPGGTTIEAVRVLEEKGLRSAVFEAQKACVKKARGL